MSSFGNSLNAGVSIRLHSAERRDPAFFPRNLWLLPIGVVGGLIAVIDGFGRPLNTEMLDVAIEALTYEPYYGAFVFAFAMLPLVLCYASSVRASRKEALLLWFVMCTVAYTKDFSYLGVPGTKLFVTEIVLGLLTLTQLSALAKRSRDLGKFTLLALACFLLAGGIAAARGFLSGQEKMLVVRDSALVLYAMFLPLGFFMASSWESVKRLFLFFALGAAFSCLNGLAWFLAQPGQRRYVFYGTYVLMSFAGIAILSSHRIIRPLTGWVLAGLLFLGILLVNARTIYMTLGAVLVGITAVTPSAQLRVSARTLKRMLWVGGVLAMVLWIFSQSKMGEEFVETAGAELVSGTINYSQDDNANFRLLAWLEALNRFSQQPAVGEGYGIQFVFELADTDPRPHNTYLTVLYKMGLLGFLPLLGILISFHWRGWKSLKEFPGKREGLLLYSLLIGQCAMSVFGFLNLLLESPFLASIFWLTLGVGMRMMYLLRTPDTGQLVTST